jgi:hypothetical protein
MSLCRARMPRGEVNFYLKIAQSAPAAHRMRMVVIIFNASEM